MKPLSCDEIEQRFAASMRHHKNKIYDGRELRSLAARLHLHPEDVRGRLRSAGFTLRPSGSGSRMIWKKS